MCLELVCNWFRFRYLLFWRQWSYKVVSAVGLPIPWVSDGLEPEDVECGKTKEKRGEKTRIQLQSYKFMKGDKCSGSLSLSLSLSLSIAVRCFLSTSIPACYPAHAIPSLGFTTIHYPLLRSLTNGSGPSFQLHRAFSSRKIVLSQMSKMSNSFPN